MAFKDRFGITTISTDDINSLEISWDFVDDVEDKKQRFPVLLFIPNFNDCDNHYHISLTKKEAKVLQKWLSDYIEGKPTRYKK
jgi:hypothetical protein